VENLLHLPGEPAPNVPAPPGRLVVHLRDSAPAEAVEYADVGYQLILEVDGSEVARADFEVREPPQA
jgi:hypothetical protein